MKQRKILSLMFYASICAVFSLCVSCDKYDLDFTTKNKFDLDASSHNFEVKTKQEEAIISEIILNGEFFSIFCQTNDCPERRDFENFTVYYRNGFVTEVEGKWFNVKVSHPHTFNISVSENKDANDRTLSIGLTWRSAENEVLIRQEAA